MIKAFASREFVLFILTGGTAALVNFGSRIVLSQWCRFETAVVLAYLVGMSTAFLLARAFVFKASRHSTATAAKRFVLVNLLAVAQTLGISLLLAYYILPMLGIAKGRLEISHAIGVVVPVFTSYLGHKHYSFES